MQNSTHHTIRQFCSKSSNFCLLFSNDLNQNNALQDQHGYDTDEDDHRGYTKPEVQEVSTSQPYSREPKKVLNTSGEEARLVNQVCTPGGVRAQPSAEDLRIFVESVGSLRGNEVAQQLEAKLVSFIPHKWSHSC